MQAFVSDRTELLQGIQRTARGRRERSLTELKLKRRSDFDGRSLVFKRGHSLSSPAVVCDRVVRRCKHCSTLRAPSPAPWDVATGN